MKNLHFFLQSWVKGVNYTYFDQSYLYQDYPSYYDCQDAVYDMEEAKTSYSYKEMCICSNKNTNLDE